MEFNQIFGKIAIIVTFILFTTTSTFACEQDCREGIAQAFVDSYALEIQPIFSELSLNISSYIYYNALVNQLMMNITLAPNLLNSIYTSSYNYVNNTLPQMILSESPQQILYSIFETEPKFKGDCNHPPRVKQPPVGVPWT